VHPAKTYLPNDVTELGTVTSVKPEQPEKALSLIVLTALEIIILISPVQPKNAASSMIVTELGIITLVKAVQFLKACFPMYNSESEKNKFSKSQH
jgi:hypothetical protein